MKTKLRPFANRITLAFSLLMLVIFLLFILYLCTAISENGKQAANNNQAELTRRISQQVQSFFSEMDNIGLRVASNDKILGYYSKLDKKDRTNYYDSHILDFIDALTTLKTVNLATDAMDRISVYNDYHDYVSGGMLQTLSSSVETKLDSLDVSQIQDDLFVTDTHCLFLSPHNDWWNEKAERMVISLLRPLGNAYSQQAYGVVQIDRNAEMLRDLISVSNDRQFQALILDQNLELFLATSDISRGTWLEIENAVHQAIETGSTQIYSKKAHVNLSVMTVLPYQFHVVTLQTQSSIQKTYNRSIVAVIIAAFALYILTVFVIHYLSKRLAHPLRRLQGALSSVSLRKMELPEIIQGPNEILNLQNAFNYMLDKIDESISLEIAAQLDAIQNQTSSHFLYNMLAIITAFAQEQNFKAVMDTSISLAEMLRYTNDFSNPTVTFTQELEHAKNYMELMHSYYESDFSFEITQSGETEKIVLPKLTLQPLVENCFKHGFSHTQPPWYVHISAEVNDGTWKIKVSNNGAPFSREELLEVERRIGEYREKPGENYKNMRFGGLGLVNTIIRMRFLYGKDFSYRIYSQPIGQTTVELEGTL